MGGNESSRQRALGSLTREKEDGRESVPCKRRARGRPATPCNQGSKALFPRGLAGGQTREWNRVLKRSSGAPPPCLHPTLSFSFFLFFCCENPVALAAAAVFFSTCVHRVERRKTKALAKPTGGTVRVLGPPSCGPNYLNRLAGLWACWW